MAELRVDSVSPKLVKVLAAVVVGASVGALLPPEPVTLPVVGAVSGLVVGVAGLLVGGLLYLRVPALLGPSECGCDGDCGCS